MRCRTTTDARSNHSPDASLLRAADARRGTVLRCTRRARRASRGGSGASVAALQHRDEIERELLDGARLRQSCDHTGESS